MKNEPLMLYFKFLFDSRCVGFIMAKMVLRELMDSSTFFKFKSFLTKVCFVRFPRVISYLPVYGSSLYLTMICGRHSMLMLIQHTT